MKKLSSIILVLGLVCSLNISVFAYTSHTVDMTTVNVETSVPSNLISTYTDIDKNHIGYDAFSYLVGKGVVRGVAVDKLAPDDTMTRASFVTMLCRNFNGETDNISESPYFEDVPIFSYYAGAVEWARIEKVTNGVSETLFGSEMIITKEQLVTMLYNYIKNHDVSLNTVEMKDTVVTDMEDVSDWAFEAVSWGSVSNILVKDAEDNFNPKVAATRTDMAIMLYNLDKQIQVK